MSYGLQFEIKFPTALYQNLTAMTQFVDFYMVSILSSRVNLFLECNRLTF